MFVLRHVWFQSDALLLQLAMSEKIRSSQELTIQALQEEHTRISGLQAALKDSNATMNMSKSRAEALLIENESLHR
jgi:hypothetical protein